MHKRFAASLAAAVTAASALLTASAPTFWTVSTQADFLKGDVDNLSIDSDGRVFLGPATTQVAETSAPFLWTVLAGPGWREPVLPGVGVRLGVTPGIGVLVGPVTWVAVRTGVLVRAGTGVLVATVPVLTVMLELPLLWYPSLAKTW